VQEYQRTFIDLALARGALRFGRFTLKSGRVSPYFYNAGSFDDGAAMATIGECYAAALQGSALGYDMLFGPAYKGIPLVTATAVALAAHHGRSVPWAFNRKEAKTHGEGGQIVGRSLAGRVVIVDDVITAGTAIRESVELIRAAGAQPVGVLLALDRQERGQGSRSAVQELEVEFGLHCVTLITLSTLIESLSGAEAGGHGGSEADLSALRTYRDQYSVAGYSPVQP
jgi:orotate phosphoribosyltransferase